MADNNRCHGWCHVKTNQSKRPINRKSMNFKSSFEDCVFSHSTVPLAVTCSSKNVVRNVLVHGLHRVFRNKMWLSGFQGK